MCNDEGNFPLITNFEIFKNLDDIDSFGFFGNANIHYPKVSLIPALTFLMSILLFVQDWGTIKTEPSFLQLGKKEWFQGSQTCEIWAGVHYKIVYAEMGYNENLQKYIVSIEKSASKVDWTFNRKTDTSDSGTQSFEVGVSFQFVKLEKSDLEGDTNVKQTAWWHIDEDLFYAFATKSGAIDSLF